MRSKLLHEAVCKAITNYACPFQTSLIPLSNWYQWVITIILFMLHASTPLPVCIIVVMMMIFRRRMILLVHWCWDMLFLIALSILRLYFVACRRCRIVVHTHCTSNTERWKVIWIFHFSENSTSGLMLASYYVLTMLLAKKVLL